METIIGLLIVILPLVFKLIGKKLEQAGQQPDLQGKPVEDWAEVLRRHVEMQQTVQAPEEVSQEQVAAPSEPEIKTKAKKTGKKSKPVLLEEPQKKREKIDVKKMIVYSEIMKPKYNG